MGVFTTAAYSFESRHWPRFRYSFGGSQAAKMLYSGCPWRSMSPGRITPPVSSRRMPAAGAAVPTRVIRPPSMSTQASSSRSSGVSTQPRSENGVAAATPARSGPPPRWTAAGIGSSPRSGAP